MMTAEQCPRAAWQALLRGDLAERDRLCRLAENLLKAGDRLAAGGPLIKGAPIRLPKKDEP